MQFVPQCRIRGSNTDIPYRFDLIKELLVDFIQTLERSEVIRTPRKHCQVCTYRCKENLLLWIRKP